MGDRWKEIDPPVTVSESEGSIMGVFERAGYAEPNFNARTEWYYDNYGTEDETGVRYTGSEYQNRDQMLKDLKDGTKLLFRYGYPLKN